MIDVETIKFIDIGGKTHAEVTAKVDHEKGGWYTEIRESTHRKTVAPGSDRQVPRVILRQYTGLKDKNGTEIYEGDIVHYYRTFICPMDGKTRRKLDVNREVAFGGGAYRFKDQEGISTFGKYLENTEVIGNIYENPELLEVD